LVLFSYHPKRLVIFNPNHNTPSVEFLLDDIVAVKVEVPAGQPSWKSNHIFWWLTCTLTTKDNTQCTFPAIADRDLRKLLNALELDKNKLD